MAPQAAEHTAAGQAGSAKRLLQRVLELRPQEASAWFALGQVRYHYKSRPWRSPVYYFGQVLSSHPPRACARQQCMIQEQGQSIVRVARICAWTR